MAKQRENRALNDTEIRDRKIVLESMPRRLIVTLATKCNSQCIMCEVRRVDWEISRGTLDGIIELFPYLESIAWQGGEVFMLDYFSGIFDEALKYPALKQTIVSNGMLLDEAWAEKLAAANMELALSIDGTDREVYEKIRYGSRYDVLLRNIRLLNEARKKTGSRLNLRMHTVIMRSNVRQIEDFLRFAQQHGFDALHMMPIWGNQQIDENIFLPGNEMILDEVRRKTARVEQLARAAGIEFLNSMPFSRSAETARAGKENDSGSTHGTPERQSTELLCHLPWQQMNVDPGGDVRPGCLCSKPIGSVSRNGLLQLWNGEPMRQYREMVLAGGGGWCAAQCVRGDVPKVLRSI